MPALTKDRDTKTRSGEARVGPAAAGARVYTGALVARNAAGYIVPGVTATGLVGLGRAEEAIDNSAGANGAETVKYRPGIFLFDNAPADPVGLDDVGSVCFVVDDQTVAATDGTNSRSKAGIVEEVSTIGVWVRFDEALTRVS